MIEGMVKRFAATVGGFVVVWVLAESPLWGVSAVVAGVFAAVIWPLRKVGGNNGLDGFFHKTTESKTACDCCGCGVESLTFKRSDVGSETRYTLGDNLHLDPGANRS